MMSRKKVYLGLGGNIGDSVDVIQRACRKIEAIETFYNFEVSKLYQTAPVSDLPQHNYTNCVCRFETERPLLEVWNCLQKIEKMFGKIKKPKNAPRIIDIDILFFGNESYNLDDLQIPHPRWQERLFVLVPLKDLVATIRVPIDNVDNRQKFLDIDLKEIIQQFPQNEMEKQCIKCL